MFADFLIAHGWPCTDPRSWHESFRHGARVGWSVSHVHPIEVATFVGKKKHVDFLAEVRRESQFVKEPISGL